MVDTINDLVYTLDLLNYAEVTDFSILQNQCCYFLLMLHGPTSFIPCFPLSRMWAEGISLYMTCDFAGKRQG